MAAVNQKETVGKQISCGTKTVGDVPDAIMFHHTGCENTKKIKEMIELSVHVRNSG